MKYQWWLIPSWLKIKTVTVPQGNATKYNSDYSQREQMKCYWRILQSWLKIQTDIMTVPRGTINFC